MTGEKPEHWLALPSAQRRTGLASKPVEVYVKKTSVFGNVTYLTSQFCKALVALCQAGNYKGR
jgi:hypothetical protein